jgi:hypothetical protein
MEITLNQIEEEPFHIQELLKGTGVRWKRIKTMEIKELKGGKEINGKI